MGRRAKKSDVSAVFVLIVIIGAIWLFKNFGWLIAIIAAIAFIGIFVNSWPKYCGVCKVELKRNSYTWNINGKEISVCPNCNRELERKKSKEAISALFQ